MLKHHRIAGVFLSAWSVSALVLSLLLLPAQAQSAEPLNDDEKRQFEEMIHDYLMENPEVMLQSIQAYREKQAQAEQERVNAAIASLGDVLGDDLKTPVGGNPEGSITIVEFFDYQCGYCKRVLSDVTELVSSDQNIRLVFKEFPILGEESILASRASLAIWNTWPERYEEFHVALMGGRGSMSNARIMETAASFDLDVNILAEAMNDPKIDIALQENYELAKSLGINGTPAFIIGGELIPGAIDLATMRELVEKAAQG